ncbi:hypothetical protein HMF8227_01765 [Saliniradius amylolyticus]|uniref:RDD domain-containing protein n=1 Tax=Saliniradius amylolyticus TaxID=2183582 RepID=A0A2S2E3L4_9ALTE|nr:RDD family protein [Saliniradius amylolyticus]AWL12238.1 hypothetical protein HMF8227_01765 [Saliniradius amylolyticus]
MHDARNIDDKCIVTPYAFGVSDEILGTPLASPLKRALAISIDMLLVGLLTHVNSIVLAAVTAAVLVRVGGKLRRRHRFPLLRKLLVGMAGVLLFVAILGVIESYKQELQLPTDAQNLTNSSEQIQQAGLTLATMVKATQTQASIQSGSCQPPLICWQTFVDQVMDVKAVASVPEEQQAAVKDAILEATKQTLEPQKRQQLSVYIDQAFAESKGANSSSQSKAGASDSVPSGFSLQEPVIISPFKSESPAQSQSNSLIAWFKGILSDLGLGFGWAALYFTVFGAWWNGQSPGKKLMGIRIVKLDASPMNLWESFGRYGGYGAGLATGLLGFLQLFWDSNRQAIQDKIAETLVIDLRKSHSDMKSAYKRKASG